MHEVLQTFRAAVERLDEDPDLRFTASSASYYRWVMETSPELFARIRELVRAGRWVVTGGQWVEPDCNLPCGESVCRQLLYGQRFLAAHLGVTATVGYNVDSFGHAGTLPQLLAAVGHPRLCVHAPRPGGEGRSPLPPSAGGAPTAPSSPPTGSPTTTPPAVGARTSCCAGGRTSCSRGATSWTSPSWPSSGWGTTAAVPPGWPWRRCTPWPTEHGGAVGFGDPADYFSALDDAPGGAERAARGRRGAPVARRRLLLGPRRPQARQRAGRRRAGGGREPDRDVPPVHGRGRRRPSRAVGGLGRRPLRPVPRRPGRHLHRPRHAGRARAARLGRGAGRAGGGAGGAPTGRAGRHLGRGRGGGRGHRERDRRAAGADARVQSPLVARHHRRLAPPPHRRGDGRRRAAGARCSRSPRARSPTARRAASSRSPCRPSATGATGSTSPTTGPAHPMTATSRAGVDEGEVLRNGLLRLAVDRHTGALASMVTTGGDLPAGTELLARRRAAGRRRRRQRHLVARRRPLRRRRGGGEAAVGATWWSRARSAPPCAACGRSARDGRRSPRTSPSTGAAPWPRSRLDVDWHEAHRVLKLVVPLALDEPASPGRRPVRVGDPPVLGPRGAHGPLGRPLRRRRRLGPRLHGRGRRRLRRPGLDAAPHRAAQPAGGGPRAGLGRRRPCRLSGHGPGAPPHALRPRPPRRPRRGRPAAAARRRAPGRAAGGARHLAPRRGSGPEGSAARLEAEGVVMPVLKRAEDGGGTVARLWEVAGAARAGPPLFSGPARTGPVSPGRASSGPTRCAPSSCPTRTPPGHGRSGIPELDVRPPARADFAGLLARHPDLVTVAGPGGGRALAPGPDRRGRGHHLRRGQRRQCGRRRAHRGRAHEGHGAPPPARRAGTRLAAPACARLPGGRGRLPGRPPGGRPARGLPDEPDRPPLGHRQRHRGRHGHGPAAPRVRPAGGPLLGPLDVGQVAQRRAGRPGGPCVPACASWP